MGKSFHTKLIELRNRLGYEYDNGGVCVLYAENGIVAWLLGPDTYKQFENRKKRIQKSRKLPALVLRNREVLKKKAIRKIKHHRRSKLNIKQKEMLDIESFMDTGELYLHPEDHRDFFGKFVTQDEKILITELVQSKELHKQGSRVELCKFIGIYNPATLKTCISKLAKYAQIVGVRFALSIGSDNHGIGMGYDEDLHSFQIIDINQENLQPVLLTKNTEENAKACELLTNQIFAAFESSYQYTGFVARLHVRGDNIVLAKKFLDLLLQDKEFEALHSIHPLASLKTERGHTLAWFTAQVGCTEILEALIADKNLNIDYPDVENHSPIWIATQNNYLNVVNMFINAKDKNDNYRVNIDRPDIHGNTPLIIAASNGHKDIASLLVNAKNPDGSSRANINAKNISGSDASMYAAKFGHVDILKILAQAAATFDYAKILQIANQNEQQGVISFINAWMKLTTYFEQLDRLFSSCNPDSNNYDLLKIYVDATKTEITMMVMSDPQAFIKNNNYDKSIACFKQQIMYESNKENWFAFFNAKRKRRDSSNDVDLQHKQRKLI